MRQTPPAATLLWCALTRRAEARIALPVAQAGLPVRQRAGRALACDADTGRALTVDRAGLADCLLPAGADRRGGRQPIAGYRYMDMLHNGWSLYVDDLVVSEYVRATGLGTELIDWLRAEAIANDCDTLHLDSGVQRGRAHKFYFDRGFHISSFHFTERLKL